VRFGLPGGDETAPSTGFRRERGNSTQERQSALIGEHVAGSDAIVTTAAVPGRRAPVLVTAEMIGRMRPGSIVVDLAAESGGNCELTRPGETVERGAGAGFACAENPLFAADNVRMLYRDGQEAAAELIRGIKSL
jgi:NAD/NADP transhydrogenase alpha subunit